MRRAESADRAFAEASLRRLQEENARLRRAVDELSLLNELAAEIGNARRVDEILTTVLRRARRAVRAEEGVITLVREQAETSMETLVRTREHTSENAAFSPDDILLHWMRLHQKALVLNDPRNDGPLAHTEVSSSIRSLISVPMRVGGRLIGILTLFNKSDGQAFGSDDARLLTIMAAQSAQVIENADLAEQRERVVGIFGQHTSPDVVEELIRHGPDIAGRRLRVAVMFADVRDFSTFAEQADPEDVVGYLNKLFEVTIACVNRNHGIVHQLLGDGFMAMFGAPISRGNDSRNAVTAGLEMIESVTRAVGDGVLPPMRLGIGVHTGDVVAGMVGSSLHREYKITGDAVNVASRLQNLNKQLGSMLLVSDSTYLDLDSSDFPGASLGAQPIRGREEAIHIFQLK